MINEKIRTCEYVSPKHPDKICDQIADAILFAHLKKDKQSRVAVEVMGGHGHLTISGEITSRAKINIKKIVQSIVGHKMAIHIFVTRQSPFIASGVDSGGAGDQGIMVGYATSETKSFLPVEYVLARELCEQIYKKYPCDGKTQMTIGEKKVLSVVASFQGTKTPELLKLARNIMQKIAPKRGRSAVGTKYFINPAGEWTLGGFDSDSGLSGRKIVVDAYGPNVPVGGGSFAGKDLTKVDRSGAAMARLIAVELLKKHKAREVLVKLAYAIGKREPVMAVAEIDGKQVPLTGYDLTPRALARRAHLSLTSKRF
jgi:S-adenosylmethionine synthetase